MERFVDQGDENAFAELVSRYRGLVMGVCRRFSHDEPAAEDAFQATFLVLARRASQIHKRSSLGGWLYAVAYRIARRANAKRFRRREEPLQLDMTANEDTLAQVADRYEQQLLDEELNRLPPKYREPLVLRYLMGKSNKEVAAELGLVLGVVEGRLKRGKDRLRVRLARRGVGLAVAFAAVGVSATAAKAAATDALVHATVEAAAAFQSGAAPAAGHSQTAIQLAEKELAMSVTTATTSTVTAAVLMAGLVLGLASDGAERPARAQAPPLLATVAMDSRAAPADEEEPQLNITVANGGHRTEPGTFDVYQPSAARRKITTELNATTQLEFIEQPLVDVIDFLRDYHGIEIQFDGKAMDDVGIPTDTPITKNLKGISLRSALDLLLRDLDLTYVIKDEVLLITTPEVADSMLETHVYTLEQLPGFDCEELALVIQKTIRADSWEDANGPGSIQSLPSCLVVTQTQHAQEEIDELLHQLAALPARSRNQKSEDHGGYEYGDSAGYGSSYGPAPRGK